MLIIVLIFFVSFIVILMFIFNKIWVKKFGFLVKYYEYIESKFKLLELNFNIIK